MARLGQQKPGILAKPEERSTGHRHSTNLAMECNVALKILSTKPVVPQAEVVGASPDMVSLPWDASVKVNAMFAPHQPEPPQPVQSIALHPDDNPETGADPVIGVDLASGPDQAVLVTLVDGVVSKIEHITAPPAVFRKKGQPILTPTSQVTILTELKALAEGKQGTLMLMQNATGIGFRVRDTKHVGGGVYQTRLVGPNKEELHPRITNNEVPKYTPLWR